MQELTPFGNGRLPPYDEEQLRDRVRELEDRVNRMESSVAGWDQKVDRILDAADAVRQLRPANVPVASLADPTSDTVPEYPALEERTVLEPKAVSVRPTEQPPAERSWFLVDLLRDFRDVTLMAIDSRYRKSATLSLMVPLLLGIFVVFWFFPIPFFGKVMDVFLAFVLYKVLSRDVKRYRVVRERWRTR